MGSLPKRARCRLLPLLLSLLAFVSLLLIYLSSTSVRLLPSGLLSRTPLILEKEPKNRESACPASGGLISADKCGRLGNVMFAYATLLAASR